MDPEPSRLGSRHKRNRSEPFSLSRTDSHAAAFAARDIGAGVRTPSRSPFRLVPPLPLHFAAFRRPPAEWTGRSTRLFAGALALVALGALAFGFGGGVMAAEEGSGGVQGGRPRLIASVKMPGPVISSVLAGSGDRRVGGFL